MHETLDTSVRGMVDRFEAATTPTCSTRSIQTRGWAFCAIPSQTIVNGTISIPLELAVRTRMQEAEGGEIRDDSILLPPIERQDVVNFYWDRDWTIAVDQMCGWSTTVDVDARAGVVEILARPSQGPEKEWSVLFRREVDPLPVVECALTQDPVAPVPAPEPVRASFCPSTREDASPSLVVIDDFYTDPTAVREFALRQKFGEAFLFPGLKERFEAALGVSIAEADWTNRGSNGCFRMCTAEDPLRVHVSASAGPGRGWVGVLFLTPDAPPACGLTTFCAPANRDKTQGRMTMDVGDTPRYERAFAGGVNDTTRFEQIDRVGNMFNRLVLFDARTIHSASQYFGHDAETGRLIQTFDFISN